MAATVITREHALAVRLWAQSLDVQALHNTEADKLVGEGPASIVRLRDELTKGAGDRLTIGFRGQLTGDGQIGNATLEGNEEDLTLYADDVYIDNSRHAVGIKGVMSQQRTLFDLRKEGKSGLVDHWRRKFDIGLINQLAGNTAQTDRRWTANNAVRTPTTRIYANGATSATSLIDTNFRFSLDMIDKAVYTAETMEVPIRKADLGGGMEGYCVLIHPAQLLDMRLDMSEGQWNDIQRAAMMGGEISKNPIFTGAAGYHNNTVIRVDPRVCWGNDTQLNRIHKTSLGAAAAGTTNVARGIFMGAGAGAIAFGRAGSMEKFRWEEILRDYSDFYGVAAGCVWGASKIQYNGTDYGVITLESYSPGV